MFRLVRHLCCSWWRFILIQAGWLVIGILNCIRCNRWRISTPGPLTSVILHLRHLLGTTQAYTITFHAMEDTFEVFS